MKKVFFDETNTQKVASLKSAFHLLIQTDSEQQLMLVDGTIPAGISGSIPLTMKSGMELAFAKAKALLGTETDSFGIGIQKVVTLNDESPRAILTCIVCVVPTEGKEKYFFSDSVDLKNTKLLRNHVSGGMNLHEAFRYVSFYGDDVADKNEDLYYRLTRSSPMLWMMAPLYNALLFASKQK